MKIDCSFFLEESQDGHKKTSVLAVFNTEEKPGMLQCYSLNEGHSSAEVSYLKTLKLADKHESRGIIETMEENYGYKINNINPF